jgi:hypothetical protein
MSESLVCRFGDLDRSLAVLAWDLGDPGALLLAGGEATPASFAIEQGGDAATLEVSAGDRTVECTLTPRSAPLALPAPTASLSVSMCKAEARLDGETVLCTGEVGRWSDDPRASAAVFRQLVVEAGEDARLVVTARGERGAPGHGEEAASAWRLQGEAEIPFEEALISTQYDGAGRPTRFGLELWPQEADQSNRTGATRVAASLLGSVDVGSVWAGVFRCHADGTEGIGSYLLWRG